jgi:hypothetical protein
MPMIWMEEIRLFLLPRVFGGDASAPVGADGDPVGRVEGVTVVNGGVGIRGRGVCGSCEVGATQMGQQAGFPAPKRLLSSPGIEMAWQCLWWKWRANHGRG